MRAGLWCCLPACGTAAAGACASGSSGPVRPHACDCCWACCASCLLARPWCAKECCPGLVLCQQPLTAAAAAAAACAGTAAVHAWACGAKQRCPRIRRNSAAFRPDDAGLACTALARRRSAAAAFLLRQGTRALQQGCRDTHTHTECTARQRTLSPAAAGCRGDAQRAAGTHAASATHAANGTHAW
jgi:hypothetical protein